MEQLKMQSIWLALAFSNYYAKQYQRTKQNSNSIVQLDLCSGGP